MIPMGESPTTTLCLLFFVIMVSVEQQQHHGLLMDHCCAPNFRKARSWHLPSTLICHGISDLSRHGIGRRFEEVGREEVGEVVIGALG